MWWLGLVVAFILLLVLVKSRANQKTRIQALPFSCTHQLSLHVVLECELGLVNDAVDTACRLMDFAKCPLKIHLHIVESVTSIKALDVLTPALEQSCALLPTYGMFFRDNIYIHKVHTSRELVGMKALRHVLQLETIHDHDFVLWVPSLLRPNKHWDTLRDDLAKIQNQILVLPLLPIPTSDKDIESLVFPETQAKPSFFVLNESFQLIATEMKRPAITPSIGLSSRHAFAAKKSILFTLLNNDDMCELCLSFKAFQSHIQLVHSSVALGHTRSLYHGEKFTLAHYLESKDDEDVLSWFRSIAISKDGEIFGRALLGVTENATLQEILVKYGSEAGFATEQEALKYG